MKKLIALCLCVGALACAAFAQDNTAATATSNDAGLQPRETVVTTNTVRAVQHALLSRGHYRARPNGTLDAETRDAIRDFQSAAQLDPNGRLDQPTLDALGVDANAKVPRADRRNGMISKAAYATKDGAVAVKDGVVTGTRTVVNGTKTGANKVVSVSKTGYDKTKNTTVGAFNRGKDVTVGTGESAGRGVKSVGQRTQGMAQRTSDAIVGRTDTDIHLDVREVLDDDPVTNAFTTSVNKGAVTLKLTPGYEGDVSPVISRMRKIGGVKSVFVVQP